MRLSRNPRRAYDREGREIPPATVGSTLDCYVLEAHCAGCQHRAAIDPSRWPADYPAPDVADHLKCSACGTSGELITVYLARSPSLSRV